MAYTEHPTYGQQFKVTSFEEKAPEDEEAIERYLGSGAIKGIGLAMAARIVRRFKEDTFRNVSLRSKGSVTAKRWRLPARSTKRGICGRR